MTAVEELIAVLKANKSDLSQFEDVLSEISGALSTLCKTADRSHLAIADVLRAGLSNLRISVDAPAVTVQAPPAPTINVQPANVVVQPSEVVVMPAPPVPQFAGWRILVISRDPNGSIAELSMKPI